MDRLLVIPKEHLRPLLHDRVKHLTRYGIDPVHLLEYSLKLDDSRQYVDVAYHVSHDIIEVFPDLRHHGSEYQTLLHQCIDCVYEMAEQILNIARTLMPNEHFMHRHLKFEEYVAGDLFVSVRK